ncbi:MAG: glycine betaine ABC transporter substrate-binding protein [Sphaerochaetaceae bacterium]|jgi:glycine betaine/proline transport system substrate-binding protein|nr:glycine betaine ABC transporter substrate-binding protein [Sphaerochaetaceae bacterium]MDD4220050.1 glycine betaine ABC transporter substrate-binding protein [Sphaerochaetaceae bacterium]MDY0372119.1 glycine betaine ABC transporter substrate-binding protein [Sphaerochaetaceae bacterium]
MKKLSVITLALLLFVTGGLFAGGEAESDVQTIVFGDVSWDSVQVHNRIVAFIIENGLTGYKAEFMPGDTLPILNGVMQGDVDVDMESWHNNFPEVYKKGLESGKFVDLGQNMPDAPQGWYVPRYLVEGPGALAPDLKSVADLPKYAHLFPDPEEPSKGQILGGVAGWAQMSLSQEIFDKNNLADTYNLTVMGSVTPIAATMVSAFKKGDPWVGYYWEPTAILGRLDMVRLKGSEWPPALVNILVHTSMLERAPDVVEILKAYSTTVEENNEFLKIMDENKWTTQETAIWFLKNKEATWTSWVSADVEAKVKKALQAL